jgi:hypothetical protein
MPALADSVYDNGLEPGLKDLVEKLHLCFADPGLNWTNLTTFTLGTKDNPTITGPQDRTGGGREIVVSQIVDGIVNTTGTATHYALTDDSNSTVLASGELQQASNLLLGNFFSTTRFLIGIPDPV